MIKPDRQAAERLVSVAIRKMRRTAFAEAAAILTAAAEIDPDCAQAWRLLGELHHREKRLSAAIGCYRRGLAAAPGQVELMVGWASACSDAGRFDEAAEMLAALVASDPENPDLLFGHALALHRGGRSETALEVLDRAVILAPDAPFVRFLRSTILLGLGRFSEGWADFDTRHQTHQAAWIPDLPLWDGTPATDRNLLVIPEGGFGDNIWAARFIPAVRSVLGRVVLALPPPLRALLTEIEGVDGFCDLRSDDGFDAYCPILSLPVRLGVSDPTAFPPARLSPADSGGDRFASLMARAGDRLRVGVLWSGSEDYSDNHHRAAPLEGFLPLIERSDIQVFSLQKGRQQAVLRDAVLGDLIIETDDSDFSETAALVRALDLVIMTDSAVAHIAGSLGTPIWTLLDFAPHWLFGGDGDANPWYPSMRLFRQKRPGDWQGVFVEVGAALDRLVASRVQ